MQRRSDTSPAKTIQTTADIPKIEGAPSAGRIQPHVDERSTASTIQYRTATGTTCNTTVIAVAGLANTSNNIRLPENVTVSAATPIFGNLGNANSAAAYTVTDTVSGRTLTVTVAASGRITIGL